jgi:hypothetical protein
MHSDIVYTCMPTHYSTEIFKGYQNSIRHALAGIA